jgi:hypothetical protein
VIRRAVGRLLGSGEVVLRGVGLLVGGAALLADLVVELFAPRGGTEAWGRGL